MLVLWSGKIFQRTVLLCIKVRDYLRPFFCKLECPVERVLCGVGPAVLTDLAGARFRSPWRPWRTHCWRHPARCSVHREDCHLREHRREGPANQKGCHATRVRAWRLEDHQSDVRGEILVIIPEHVFVSDLIKSIFVSSETDRGHHPSIRQLRRNQTKTLRTVSEPDSVRWRRGGELLQLSSGFDAGKCLSWSQVISISTDYTAWINKILRLWCRHFNI